MQTRVAVLEANFKNLKETSDTRHEENRQEFHIVQNTLKALNTSVTNLKIHNAKWNIFSGAATAIAIKVLEHYWK